MPSKPRAFSIFADQITSAGNFSLTGAPSAGDVKAELVTIASSGTSTMESFDSTKYSAVKYFVQATSGSEIYFTELTVLHNNSNILISEIGTVSTSVFCEFTAELVAGSVNLKITTTLDNTYVNYRRIALISNLLPSLAGDLSSMTGTEDLMTGTGIVDLMV